MPSESCNAGASGFPISADAAFRATPTRGRLPPCRTGTRNRVRAPGKEFAHGPHGVAGQASFRQGAIHQQHPTVARSLRALDPSITLEWVKQVTGLYEPQEILRAKSQTELARPGDVKAFFKAQFRAVVPARTVARVTVPPAVHVAPEDDPYG